jgi:hypothetical protein
VAVKDINKRIRRLERDVEPQEQAERVEAAERYAGESPQHYVDFCHDAVQTSVRSMEEVRRVQDECWRLYNEEEPPNYAYKDDWQSKVVLPKPHGSVQFAQAIVRKAFDTEFLSVENRQDEEAARFWESMMTLMLSRNYGKFTRNFTDATGMGFAVGTSLEVIPVWRPNHGLKFVLVEPWKIHRDPDAVSREPQSGMYWIHQEYVDLWLLKQYEKQKRYMNIPEWDAGGGSDPHPSNPNLMKENIERRKDMFYERSKYRKMVLTSEYWGHVISPNGELLMENATYTVAANEIIKAPVPSPYRNTRWPGTSFSPIPHLLRHDGRGLLQGVRTLWYFMSSLLCLYNDYMNWIVNPPTEIDITSLVDPTNIDDTPGKLWLTRGTVSGQQAIRTIDRPSRTTDILALLGYGSQVYDEGTLVNSVVKGLPGYRAEVTAREAAQQLDQSMTVFGLIGSNLEDGALSIIEAAADTIAINITYPEMVQLMGQEIADKYRQGEVMELPDITAGAFSVSGISSLMRDWEVIQNIAQIAIPMFESPVFQPYTRPYQLCLAVEKRLSLEDEGLFVDAETAQRVDEAQQATQEQVIGDEAQQSTALTEQMQREAMSTPTSPEVAEGEATMPAESAMPAISAVPTRAAGGPVEEGNPYVVGEGGPELFVPAQPGMILNPTQVQSILNSTQDEQPVMPTLNQEISLAGKA